MDDLFSSWNEFEKHQESIGRRGCIDQRAASLWQYVLDMQAQARESSQLSKFPQPPERFEMAAQAREIAAKVAAVDREVRRDAGLNRLGLDK